MKRGSGKPKTIWLKVMKKEFSGLSHVNNLCTWGGLVNLKIIICITKSNEEGYVKEEGY